MKKFFHERTLVQKVLLCLLAILAVYRLGYCIGGFLGHIGI